MLVLALMGGLAMLVGMVGAFFASVFTGFLGKNYEYFFLGERLQHQDPANATVCFALAAINDEMDILEDDLLQNLPRKDKETSKSEQLSSILLCRFCSSKIFSCSLGKPGFMHLDSERCSKLAKLVSESKRNLQLCDIWAKKRAFRYPLRDYLKAIVQRQNRKGP